MKTKSKIIAAIIIFLVALFTLWWIQRDVSFTVQKSDNTKSFRVNDTTFTANIAITGDQKFQGLSNTTSLPENHAIVFVYDHYDQFPFVMRDMKYPLDFLWVKDKTIVDITENAPPEGSNPEVVYQPKNDVNIIIEVNAGTVEKYGIEIGDTIEFDL